MKLHWIYCLVHSLLFLGVEMAQAQSLITFSSIPGRTPSEHYKCRVRLKNSPTWENVFVLQTTAKKAGYGYVTAVQDWTASWIAFEFAAGNEVEVEISKVNGKPIKKAMLRPVGDATPALIRNGKAYVTFTKHANVNVDIDGQMEDNFTGQGYTGPPVHTISLFGNPIYHKPTSLGSRVKYLNPGEAIPTDDSWDTLCFQPGVHRIFQYDANGIRKPFLIRSNKVINIPGDAVVHGTFQATNTGQNAYQHNGDGWMIYGSGTISGEEIPHYSFGDNGSGAPFDGYATRIRLEGFVVADAAEHHFNIANKNDDDANVNVFKNLKTLAWRVNTDGGALQRNTITSDCFFRLQDDLLYCCRSKARISNCVVWIDHNGSMGVYATWFTSDPVANPIKDIKAIYNRRSWHAGGTSGVRFRDAKLGSSIQPYTISNILVEDPYPSYGLFGFSMEDPDPNTINPAPIFQGAGIAFENIVQPNHANVAAVTTGVPPHNEMKPGKNIGQNDELLFSNITFKNFAYLQVPTTSFAQAKFTGKAGANINFIAECNNLTSGGRISANQTVGSITAPDPIVGEMALNPNGGIIEYVWVKSTTDPNPSLTTGQRISRATDAIYYPGVLKQTTHFRRFARRAGCTDYVGSENSVTITVVSGGEISTDKEAFCAGNKPDVFRHVSAPQVAGNLEYIWLKSTTGIPELVEDADTIANATGENLVFDGLLTTTTYFQRFARCPSAFTGYTASNCIKIMVGTGLLAKYYGNLTSTGTPSLVLLENPGFKYNSAPQSKKDIMIVNQSSIVWSGSVKTDSIGVNTIGLVVVGSSDLTINGQQWIASGTAYSNGRKTYTMPFSQGVWYPIKSIYGHISGTDRQLALSIKGAAYCPNPVCNNLTSGGAISGDQEICYGTTPAPLLNVEVPAGGSGSIEYIWVRSTTACPASPSSGELIAGATGASYSPGALTQTTYFRRFARSSGCTDFSASSNCVRVEIDHTPPVFASAPSNITKTITSGSSAPVTYEAPIVTDNCGNITITRTGLASDSAFPIGVSTITYTATDSLGNTDSTSFTVTVVNICQNVAYTPGTVNLMRWVSSSINSNAIPIQIPNTTPTLSSTISSTDGAWNIGLNNYITRVFGYIVAPTTGNYRFNVTGDDRVTLYLSSTCAVQDTTMIAFTPGHTSRFQHTNFPAQTSGLIPLVQGSTYYFELRQVEISGNDGWSLYWQTPTDSRWRSIQATSLARLSSSNSDRENINTLSTKEDGVYAPLEVVQFNEEKDKEALTIYPNPSNGSFTIDLKSYSGKAANIYLYNSIGQQMQYTKIEKVGHNLVQFNVGTLPSGNYLVRVVAEEGRSKIGKVLVTK